MAFDTILSLDTATEAVTVALLKGNVTFTRSATGFSAHSEHVISFIDEVLKEGNSELKDVEAIAFGAGPGAFTGLRVACAVAQGLGWAADKPLVAISNLAAAAFATKVSGRILSVLDARMHQCYAAVFDCEEGMIPKAITEPVVANPEDLVAVAKENAATLITGDALPMYESTLAHIDGVTPLNSKAPDALTMAYLAQLLAREGNVLRAIDAAPIYVRNRVALTIEDRAKGETL